MAVAALRPMLSIAREEAAVLVETAPRAVETTSLSSTTATVAHEVANPLAVRQAVQSHVVGETLPRLHLAELDALPTLRVSPVPSLAHTSAEASVSRALGEGQSIIARALEESASVKDTLSNAGQTGLGDAAEQIVQAAEALLEGRGKEAQAGVGAVKAARV
ncbi:hypothetical protein Q5752_001360 [Cryptotrichosporon argae]